MSHERDLVETIKRNFARRSTTQLQEIAGENDRERWSAEATVAAGEVLRDRRAGIAEEPQSPEIDEPPEYSCVPEHIALGVLFGLFSGLVVIPYTRRETDPPDFPMPFGRNMAWLAMETTDTGAVASALGLTGAKLSEWGEGIEAAHSGSVFVTPPLGEWTLAVGTPLFHGVEVMDAVVRPLLERLSRQFGDVQYFCNHAELGLLVWARAVRGRLVRGYGWLGTQSRTIWEAGSPTPEESDLGFRRGAGQPPMIDPGDRTGPVPFTDESLFQLACRWSIDPTTLDESFLEPVSGLLGKLPR